jgi:glycogen(starch) synthase
VCGKLSLIQFGKWLIPGSPFVLLFDIGSAYGRLQEWKTDLWLTAQIPSPDNDNEMHDSIIFGIFYFLF